MDLLVPREMVLGDRPAGTADTGGHAGTAGHADTVGPEVPVLPENHESLAILEVLGVIGASALEKNVATSPTPIQH